MGATETMVRAQNAASPRLPITDRRAAELPVELNQLAAAAEAMRHLLQFDTEPADFVRTLHALAWKD